MARSDSSAGAKQPNILILCMDHGRRTWRCRGGPLPGDGTAGGAGRELRPAVLHGAHLHAVAGEHVDGRARSHTGLWDNTNFAWITELSPEIPTIGQLLREPGYYTAFKGKWHLSDVARDEGALERYGFADYQQWGEMFGAPLHGAQLDGAAVFETVDWLEHRASRLDQPWLLVCSLVNPHDIMFYQSDPIESPHPNGSMAGLQTTAQGLSGSSRVGPGDATNFADD